MTGRTAAVLSVCALVLSIARSLAGAEPATPQRDDWLVVMSDGRILRGSVVRHATGYYVERPGGRMLVPHEQIRCVARSLPDAYRQQREAMVNPTSAGLIQLAEWCISYHLYDEAADELRRALRREPQNDVARQMLARLQEQLLAAPTKPLERPAANRYGELTPEVESLGGLSRETAATFTSKIQPLLMNKCGNAGCHGQSDDNGFRLTGVRFGSANHRRSAEMNLALVLSSIDIHNPNRSPLLQQIRGGHGGAPVTLFGGPQGTAQLKMLTDWVQAVAAERVAEEEKLAKRPPLKSQRGTRPSLPEEATAQPVSEASDQVVIPAGGATEPEQGSVIQLAGATSEPSPGPAEETPEAVAPRRRIDRFDPEEFNARFGVPAQRPK